MKEKRRKMFLGTGRSENKVREKKMKKKQRRENGETETEKLPINA